MTGRTSRGVWHIVGPPGTGKTTHLSRRIRATEQTRGEGSTCVISYTKVAAKEIVNRGLPAEEKDRHRGESADGVKRMGTMHSLLYQMLGRPSIADVEPHVSAWNKTQPEDWQLSGGVSMDDLDTPKYKTEADRLMQDAQRFRAQMRRVDLWPADVRAFHNAWTAWKEKEGHVDFTGLVEAAIEQGTPPPEGCTVGIVDEAQDFSRLELTLIRQWSEYWDATVFGFDDDQAIFSWRGADASALPDEMPSPPERIKVLEQSYRVPRAVHSAATRWIERCRKRVPKQYHPRETEGRVRRVGASYRHAGEMADMITMDLAQGGSAMVLASCGYMLGPIIKELRERGVPFHNPWRPQNGAWNPLSAGATARRVLAFSRRNPQFWGEEAFLHMWRIRELADWTRHLGAGCFASRGKKKELQDLAKNPEQAGEFADETQFLSPACLEWVDRGDLDAFHKAVLATSRRAYDFPLRVARRDIRQLDTRANPPRIIPGTVHSVKGGESDHVYVIPDLSMAGMRQWERAGTKDHDDVRRVFYVAMTRARETLTILGPGGNRAVEGM